MKYRPDYIESLELFHPDIAFTTQIHHDPDWMEKEMLLGPNRSTEWLENPFRWLAPERTVIRVEHKPTRLCGLSLTGDSHINEMVRGLKALGELKQTLQWVSR